ncbi:hypothetical protein KP509_09G023200 [Ceratopteris richardii]|uniref:Cyclic nucleotide-binding domain-containing protein n=1 Tax=Ceratopteris richardii TaxID=49495 RepID=A0A8T2U5A1_CERRI|nr:hypothetical protein KP509_09G023200 [Ceratopteris richardii]KAH7428914.1 hypothetical protein KP509_09G023200 [Ceratopteris richardii]
MGIFSFANWSSLLRKCLACMEGNASSDDCSEPSSSKRDLAEQCNECTQKGLPRFHSISCEQNHQLFLEVNAGSSLYPVSTHIPFKPVHKKRRQWLFGTVQDPRRKVVQRWNQLFLLARSVSLAIDPLFFYVFAVKKEETCIYIDGSLAATVTLLRTSLDAVHVLQMWLQLKLAYVSKESLVLGRGSLVWDAREIALHYIRSGGGFWFDLFVILPIPQVILWAALPHIISKGEVRSAITIYMVTILVQFIPKVLHLVIIASRIRHVTGFVFGTVWWGFALNLTAYFIAAHVAGACWYLLATQRMATCLIDQCNKTNTCLTNFLGCSKPSAYGNSGLVEQSFLSRSNETRFAPCFGTQNAQDYSFGIFQWALPLITGHSWSTKFAYPVFWGLMTLSSFGNALQPSDQLVEVCFSIIVITCGLLLFTLLIGNIQVFLHSMTAKKEAMKLRLRDLECWMRRRQLPSRLRHRVRRYERHHWAATRGVDEVDMLRALPEGLRRDIKQHLSLDLVRQVPLFEHMDSLVLENICERLKPHLYIKNEVVIREGDPVQRMLFIVRGHLLSSHNLSNGRSSICCLGPGNFCGDELLTWCLKRPFVERLPPSFATLTSTESTEAFGLDAQDLKFVTEHFRYKFVSENLKRTARYYSSGWRTWAVVTIQLAWRRYRARKAKLAVNKAMDFKSSEHVIRISPLARSESEGDRLRFYAAMFNSHKPQDHLD